MKKDKNLQQKNYALLVILLAVLVLLYYITIVKLES